MTPSALIKTCTQYIRFEKELSSELKAKSVTSAFVCNAFEVNFISFPICQVSYVNVHVYTDVFMHLILHGTVIISIGNYSY